MPIDGGLEGDSELSFDATRCGIRGTLLVAVAMPFRSDVVEGTLVEGKEESEVCRLIVVPPKLAVVVPLVDGRYERPVAMAEWEPASLLMRRCGSGEEEPYGLTELIL